MPSCGHQTCECLETHLAIILEQPPQKQQLQVVGLERVEDPRYLPLGHPSEEKTVSALGLVWNELVQQGRLVVATQVICRQCSHFYVTRALYHERGHGFLTVAAVAVASGAIAALSVWNVFAGFLSIGGFVVSWDLFRNWAKRRYVRRSLAAQAAAIAAEVSCPRCQGDQSVPVCQAKMIRCPVCKVKSLSFKAVGIS